MSNDLRGTGPPASMSNDVKELLECCGSGVETARTNICQNRLVCIGSCEKPSTLVVLRRPPNSAPHKPAIEQRPQAHTHKASASESFEFHRRRQSKENSGKQNCLTWADQAREIPVSRRLLILQQASGRRDRC